MGTNPIRPSVGTESSRSPARGRVAYRPSGDATEIVVRLPMLASWSPGPVRWPLKHSYRNSREGFIAFALKIRQIANAEIQIYSHSSSDCDNVTCLAA